jgi:hypothetical protein
MGPVLLVMVVLALRRLVVTKRPASYATHDHPALWAWHGSWPLWLIGGLQALCGEVEASSIHLTFLPEIDWKALGVQGFLQRQDEQFHWINNNYTQYEDFLASLQSRKRKALRKAADAADAAREEMTSEIAKMKAQLAVLQGERNEASKPVESIAPAREPVASSARPRMTPKELIAQSQQEAKS